MPVPNRRWQYQRATIAGIRPNPNLTIPKSGLNAIYHVPCGHDVLVKVLLDLVDDDKTRPKWDESSSAINASNGYYGVSYFVVDAHYAPQRYPS